ncbi:128_t:CDS:2 [Racocetra fulgida]|uniref:homocitrate synthase n=1 Tax=Racocetra fulgida TaxID=60492 RepID=A0A9N8VP80_9GLOM|nr:128_t:CDS:2 [Racocetra fulgida]
MADPNIRTTPRLKVSLTDTSPHKKLNENEAKPPPPGVKLEQWKRLQELKRRREEVQNGGSKKKNKQDDRLFTNCREEEESGRKYSDSSSAPDQTTSQSSTHLLDQTIPPIIPKGLIKYVNMNSHLKGVDHGRLAQKGRLEKELDKAVESGELELASKISDQIAQRNYENTMREAIERKEYDERKKKSYSKPTGTNAEIRANADGSEVRKLQPNVYTRYYDLLSRVNNFSIIESTLREGEQFANAFFDTNKKIEIAKALDEFGVEYIELTSPAASEQSRLDCEAICKLGLKAKILTHIRCHMDDAKIAVETGVDGVDVVIGTSSYLREFSHGKDMDYIAKKATEVINFVKSKGIEVRFSSEDSFRSDLVDLLSIYRTVDKLGVNRVGIADTVGCANPRQVYELVRTLRGVVSCDIECHFHNDTGCAIANAYAALEAGATHIDTSILGIGERNGITPLGGLIARMYTADKDYIKSKYKLHMLRDIENLVADSVDVQVPFNNYITGYCAFTHKAGIHAKAILNNPSTYEILKPEDFGLTDDQVKTITAKIKELSDIRPLKMEDVDNLLREYHSAIESGDELLVRNVLSIASAVPVPT